MKRDVKLLLCFTALVGAMFTGITFAADITVGENDSFVVNDANVDNIRNDGTFSNSLELSNVNEIVNTSNFENSGNIVTNKFSNSGNVSGNEGSISITSGNNDGSVTQKDITISGSFRNNGNFEVKGTLSNSGNLVNNSSPSSSGIVADAIKNSSGASLSGNGNIEFTNGTNEGTISTSGDLIINSGGTLNNTGTIILQGNFKNDASIKGSGDMTVKDGMNTGKIDQASFNISEDGKFTNDNSISVESINNKGVLTNNKQISAENFENTQTINGKNGVLSIDQGCNTGEISQKEIEVNVGDFINEGNITTDVLSVNGSFVNEESGSLIATQIINNYDIVNNGIIGTDTNRTELLNYGTYTNEKSLIASSIENTGFITNSNSIVVSNLKNDYFLTGNGKLEIGSGVNNREIVQKEITIDGIFENNKNVSTDLLTVDGSFINNSLLLSKNIVNNNSVVNNGNVGNIKNKASIINNGTFTNSNTVIASTILNVSGKEYINNKDTIADQIINNGTITNTNNIVVSNLENNSNITGSDGHLEILNGFNKGSITQKEIIINEKGSFKNQDLSTLIAKEITNNGNLYQEKESSITTENLVNNSMIDNSGSITIDSNMTNKGTITNKGTFDTGSEMTNEGLFINSGEDAILSAKNIINKNSFRVDNKASVTLENIENTSAKIYLTNGANMTVSSQQGVLDGSLIVEKGENNFSLTSALDDGNFVGNLIVGNNKDNSIFNFNKGVITEDAIVNVTKGGRLNIQNSTLTLNEGDGVNGDLTLKNGGVVNFDGYNLTTGATSTLTGGSLAYYEQSGGDLNIINNSALSMGNSSLITGGNILIDDDSAFISRSGGFKLNDLKTSGLLGAMNVQREDYYMDNLIIGNVDSGKNKTDLTIDVHARSNASHQHGTDKFIAGNIKEADGLDSALINISDWGLAGDIFGWDAPIDRDITLENIFSGNISENVSLTSTQKEVFTPIGWYQLNNHGGTTGNYTLNLTRFNPQVYRGQVTTLAQWMNQLAIDDMLFNHSMLIPSFKDEDGGMAYSGVMSNRYASVDPVFAPYQYSRKDGGLWYKMYGTFETMQMSQGLSSVGNNAYGALIGADFGLRELKNGWKYMPTAYIGYNGAHQYYSGVGAYQNGGQIGFLNTLYKNNFILGGLIYGGIYDNAIDVAGRNDNTFNYFGGAAIKTAYNIRLHRDWVLQPNLFAAYNYFGQQNWHSTYGQMGMMSGMLNGVNIAPGLNLIWEKETFSIYATLQYMYNANGAVGGRAGNVNLPHLCMDRGYIQYGLGFTKRVSDRFSGYLQAVLRNVGRTGVGFQMGFNIQLGK